MRHWNLTFSVLVLVSCLAIVGLGVYLTVTHLQGGPLTLVTGALLTAFAVYLVSRDLKGV
jgi:hypothetical protein